MPLFPLHLSVLLPWKAEEGLISEENFKTCGEVLLIALPAPQHLAASLQLLFLEAPAGVTATLTIFAGPCFGLVHTPLWSRDSQRWDLSSKESEGKGPVPERRVLSLPHYLPLGEELWFSKVSTSWSRAGYRGWKVKREDPPSFPPNSQVSSSIALTECAPHPPPQYTLHAHTHSPSTCLTPGLELWA